MSTYNLTLTFENIRTLIIIGLDIFIMWAVLYYAIKIVKSNTRTIQIFKGILLVVIFDSFAKFFGLKTVEYITSIFINWGFLAFIIIFQPELRSLLERIGKTNLFSRITTLTGDEKESLVDNIVKSVMLLSQNQIGALISLEQGQSLEDYIATGTPLHSDVTTELLTSLFVTSTPLHDGAVIIQGDKIACASAYFPPTNMELPSRYGARHRAAIGISEITDAVTIIVSEETGTISITEGGKIRSVNERELRDYLLRVICGEETEVRSSYEKAPQTDARVVVVSDAEKKKEVQADQGNTGVFSKLAIRRQAEEAPAKTAGKAPITTVTPPDMMMDEELPSAEEATDPGRGRRPLFSNLFSQEPQEEPIDEMDALHRAASDIKLPKKNKDHGIPAIPERHHYEEYMPEEPVMPVNEQLPPMYEPEQPVYMPEPEMPVYPQEEYVPDMSALEIDAPAAVEPEMPVAQPRMTPEEVRMMREATKKKLSTMTEDIEISTGTAANNAVPLDTTRLDVTKIVGISGEIDEKLNMIDMLDTAQNDASASAQEEQN